MKKVTVSWTEFHSYSTEIEIPDNLSNEEELDWVINNTNDWSMGWHKPFEIETAWDSFVIDEVK
jgi:hypothetical protein